MEYARQKKQLGIVLDIFYKISVCVLIINDVLLFTTSSSEVYLLGLKFSVAYFHMFVITLWFIRLQSGKISRSAVNQLTLFILIILSIITGIRVDCMTGVVGLALMMTWFLLGTKFPKFVCNPVTAVSTVLISYGFLYVAPTVMHNSAVRHFVVDILHRDPTMTGRTNIFEVFPQAFEKKPFLGYGYGVSYDVMSWQGIGFVPDTQNGLAEIMLAGGLAAGALLLALIWNTIKSINPQVGKMRILAVTSFIYALICIATVEITFSTLFFACLVLLANISKEKVKA
ncbi:O-antigen ligase family protein [Bifidobacterium oedipodis]|nr:O-antigen ligase family protein [Bifidobacterium sp. DSM 109957]